ncbi:MAG TPA: sugar kinase, partial [Propionibacteriaceae bacterium]|nr:sugar kinase [Propionibacteriaceae bacterium]
QLWTILRRLRTIARVEQVRATGGVFRSSLWREVTAGILNRPLVVTGAAEGSALGAAILGAKALDIVPTLAEGYSLLRPDAVDEVVPVSPSDALVYTELREGLQGLLERFGRLGIEFR